MWNLPRNLPDTREFDSCNSLTLYLSHEPPANADARQNWLPAPDDQFALIVRTYVPMQELLDCSYKLPNVERLGPVSGAH